VRGELLGFSVRSRPTNVAEDDRLLDAHIDLG
jgi:hypothetical protein